MKSSDECYFSIVKQFSRFPGGRLKVHGPKSGEEFREEFLMPLIKKCDEVTIDLTGAVGYGASFLDESFGELGKLLGEDIIKEKVTLVAEDDPNLVSIIWKKIEIGARE